MFERRLKVFLTILFMGVIGLLLRAAQLQVAQRDYWNREAADSLKSVSLQETTRGPIIDCKGRVLAEDRPCRNVCVQYQVLLDHPDKTWIARFAAKRVKSRLGDDAWKKLTAEGRKRRIGEESGVVLKQIDRMWDKLARLTDQTREDIERVRHLILQRVDMRRRYVWYHSYLRAMRQQNGVVESEPKWQKWLSGESDDGPQVDKFAVTVAEEDEAHVIVRDVSLEVENELSRHIDEYPGVELKPGLHRYYPFHEVACHVIGRLGKVGPEELLNDPNHGDQRRKYWPNDDVGRLGLEGLCEPALRGTLGRTVTVSGEETPTIDPAIAGQTVRIAIDTDIQRDIEDFFAHATLYETIDDAVVEERDQVLHGAAVLLDVKTNRVLALVSYPTYDVNELDANYQRLKANDVDAPLRNRATESQLEPGSTVKPLVGLAAITDGYVKLNEGIECKGYLELPDHHGGMIHYGKLGRCWIASTYAELLHDAVAHHPVPTPHRGHDGNRDGWLTYRDALERSCNVYFETVADRLGIATLSDWMGRFGLGRPTGIGIEEFKGWVPAGARGGDFRAHWRATGFSGGIGQGYIAATPLQMANIAATIARSGIWMRPQLVIPASDGEPMPPMRPAKIEVPDRVDLHLDPEALAACKLGMIEVVNARAGTGKAAHMKDLFVAGKTGTAQGAAFRLLKLLPDGKPQRDADGRPMYETFELSTFKHPNPRLPWYRGSGPNLDKHDHAWMIGFAPADDPKIAFGVLVEYGGSGGGAAAEVVKAALTSCMAHGYLTPAPPPPVIDDGAVADAHDAQ